MQPPAWVRAAPKPSVQVSVMSLIALALLSKYTRCSRFAKVLLGLCFFYALSGRSVLPCQHVKWFGNVC